MNRVLSHTFPPLSWRCEEGELGQPGALPQSLFQCQNWGRLCSTHSYRQNPQTEIVSSLGVFSLPVHEDCIKRPAKPRELVHELTL